MRGRPEDEDLTQQFAKLCGCEAVLVTRAIEIHFWPTMVFGNQFPRAVHRVPLPYSLGLSIHDDLLLTAQLLGNTCGCVSSSVMLNLACMANRPIARAPEGGESRSRQDGAHQFLFIAGSHICCAVYTCPFERDACLVVLIHHDSKDGDDTNQD